MTARVIHVVDDDPVVRETLVWMLEAVGFAAQAHGDTETVPVETGACVILDEDLGAKGSGLDRVDPVSGRLAHHPVVLLTGRAGDSFTRERAAQVGIQHLLGKPVQIAHLISAVEAAIHDAR